MRLQNLKNALLKTFFFRTFFIRRLIPNFFLDFLGVHSAIYKSPLADALMTILREGNEQTMHTRIGECLAHYHSMGLFSCLLPEKADSLTKYTKMLFILTHNHYELRFQLFYLNQGDCHPPHAHSGIVSAAMLLGGEIHLLEADIKAIETNTAILRAPHLRNLAAKGDIFYTPLQNNRMHFFYGDTQSLVLNVNVRGVAHISTHDAARSYVDIAAIKQHGDELYAPLIDWQAAHQKYNRNHTENYRIPTL